MTTRARSIMRVLALAAVFATATASAPVARADSTVSGPTVAVDRKEVKPGDPVVLTISGFTKSFVNVAFCGNAARQGSADCNMAASAGFDLDFVDAPTVYKLKVATPPKPCPCVVRVSNGSLGEIAVSEPISIGGMTDAPVVDPPSTDGLVEGRITARAAPSGLMEALRTQLGGPATYEATVTVHNRSAVPLRNIKIAASVDRGKDGSTTLDFGVPGELLGGQTWKSQVMVHLPAPTFGSTHWTLEVYGAGSSTTAEYTTTSRPVLLFILLAVLIICVVLVLMRMLTARHARNAAEAESGERGADAAAGADEPRVDPVESTIS